MILPGHRSITRQAFCVHTLKLLSTSTHLYYCDHAQVPLVIMVELVGLSEGLHEKETVTSQHLYYSNHILHM